MTYHQDMADESKSEPRWLNAAEMKAWRRYIIASRRLLEALDDDLAAHDISMSDYEVLAQLSEAPDRRMRMSELADVAMISRSRLSHRIKVMEKSGWVKREACPIDKRGYFAVMTPKGWKAIVAAAPDHVSSVRDRFLDALDKSEQKTLAEIFERVAMRIKHDQ